MVGHYRDLNYFYKYSGKVLWRENEKINMKFLKLFKYKRICVRANCTFCIMGQLIGFISNVSRNKLEITWANYKQIEKY